MRPSLVIGDVDDICENADRLKAAVEVTVLR